MKVAIYARVSSSNGTQDYQRQISELTELSIAEVIDKANDLQKQEGK